MKIEKGREESLCALQKKLSYNFKRAELLQEALTHSSYANEKGGPYNERLEFLGDAVLELITSQKLFKEHPDFKEGQLTRLRAQIVCKNSLASWAVAIGLKDLILVGNSLTKCGPTDSIAADCVEALFGAAFLDGGFLAAEHAVSQFLDYAAQQSGAAVIKDPKTQLQEYLQGEGRGVPVYETLERTGPEHASNFKVRILIDDKVAAVCWGSSIKDAEFKAAAAALKNMRG